MNKLFIVFFVGALLSGAVSAANYYVDNTVASSGNGQSWSTAWKAFSNIAWASVQPGDTIYISGGSTSQIYNDTLVIGKSGTAGNLITITKGVDAGHNGEVIIDRNFAAEGVNIVDIHDFRILDLTIRNCNYGIKIDGNSPGSVNNLYIDSSRILYNYNRGIEFSGWGQNGLARDYITNVYIRYNTIITSPYSTTQTDAIYGQYFINAFILNNNISQINRRTPSSHCDGIQLYAYQGATIGNNFVTVTSSGTEPDQAIIIEPLEEQTTYIYNNVLYTPTWDGYSNTLLLKVNVAGTGRYYVYGNTLIGRATVNLLNFYPTTNAVTDAYVKNNIFYSSAPSPSVRYSQSIIANHIDNNLYYYTTGIGSIANYNGDRTLNGMRSAGAETHGLVGNPDFVGVLSNWHLQTGSPAVDVGANVGSPYNIDRDGVVRPQGAAWDIGAYEYGSGGTQFDPADTNQNGCISLPEMSAYVVLWLNNYITLDQVSSSIIVWLQQEC